MSEVVLTQDISSGRVHKRYRMPGGQLASFEGDNLDDAGDYTILPPDTDLSGFDCCANCFSVEAAEDDGGTANEVADA